MYVLILGAKSAIGEAIAAEYASHGYDLYLAGRGKKEIDKIATDLAIRYKVQATALEFDALNFARHKNFYAGIKEKCQGVICVFGYMPDEDWARADFRQTQKIIDTNYSGAVSILNIIAQDMEKNNQGFIIGISSVAGDRGRKRNYLYGSSKAAFSTYLSGLRQRLAHTKIRVITVKPGFVHTPMTEKMNLPKLLTAMPQEVARDIYRAQAKGKDIVYTKWFWKWIMLVIKIIPEKFFKKLNF
jgi:hypothetical protein